ncbi:hypothetical protein ACFFQW_00900 [Umezawaea endophytica]|uniref:Uncharacterized protein n=1 Tax=Umezawaea endophytica TaxID=1654476 RepID=A0A9X2VHN8_9PSEU|nr:hypothetical protein [Umezawaea endophytica]MCS7476808.1 hypothetical protein [Umezawaea endophytica]
MKREHDGPVALSVHEAGHLVIAHSQEALTVGESIWSDQGFTYTNVGSEADWTKPAEKVRSIAAQVAVAVAGGAAELVVHRGVLPEELTVEDVLAETGSIDFQLAQEWLALQRHDPSQDAIEAEVLDVFHLVAAALADRGTSALVSELADRLLARRRREENGTVRLGSTEPEVAALLAGARLPAEYPLTRTTTANLISVTTH